MQNELKIVMMHIFTCTIFFFNLQIDSMACGSFSEAMINRDIYLGKLMSMDLIWLSFVQQTFDGPINCHNVTLHSLRMKSDIGLQHYRCVITFIMQCVVTTSKEVNSCSMISAGLRMHSLLSLAYARGS